MAKAKSHKKARAARFLIVTCDDDMARSLARDIETPVFCVDVERDAATVTQLLAVNTFVVVFIDADGLSGDEGDYVSRVREAQPGAFIIVMSANPSKRFLIQLLRSGIYDFIAKPFDRKKIASLIRFLGERKIVSAVQAEVSGRLKTTSAVLERDHVDLSREVFRANQELQKLNSRLKQHVSQLTILYQMGRDISENENWSDALDRFLMALVNYTKAGGAALLLFSDEECRLGLRSNFQVDPAILSQSCQVLLQNWKRNPRGSEIHTIESYREGDFKTCLERAARWRYTLIPLRHRSRALGFLFIEKEYMSGISFKTDYHFFNTIQTILGEEVANASYIS